ncbi:MAG: site-specific integrase [Terracidiphilus sp.]|jgi:integrase
MPKDRIPKQVKGVFERPPGSGCWWVNYYIGGKQHREKVGRKSDAIMLYQKRKVDALRNKKLPELRPRKATSFGELATAAVDYAKAHLKTWPDYVWKERTLREPFGSRPAAEIIPEEIDNFLTEHCKTPATANRFRAFFSLCFHLGMENGKVSTNPARLVRLRTEDNARNRYLSRQEYESLSGVILRDFPQQHPAFVVSVFTGMRWEVQFSLVWSQVDLKRHVIHLWSAKDPTGRVQTKARNIPLNSIALAAMKQQQKMVPHEPTDPVFPNAGDYCRFWFEPCLKKAKIDNYTWHCNRHTFCSWLALEGVSMKAIQELACHKSIAMTARYMHLAPQTTAAASERMVAPSA